MYTSHELARIAADAARQVGPYLIEAFSRPRTVELKADFHDVVTVHDKESQRRIADFLFAETPESFIVGEESSRMLTCDAGPEPPAKATSSGTSTRSTARRTSPQASTTGASPSPPHAAAP